METFPVINSSHPENQWLEHEIMGI